MLDDLLQDRAALYVAGAMTALERENFELILAFQPEVRSHVAALNRTMAAVMVTEMKPSFAPPDSLKRRLLAEVTAHPERPEPEAMVVTGPDGLVQWINPAFTAMCGYSLDELKGCKPGHLLQGPATDKEAVGRIRDALRSRQPCRETLANYHKNGSLYRADVRITPILDDENEPRWFVAQERLLGEGAVASPK